MPERFEIYIVYKRRYINTLPFLSFKEHVQQRPQDDTLRYAKRHTCDPNFAHLRSLAFPVLMLCARLSWRFLQLLNVSSCIMSYQTVKTPDGQAVLHRTLG